jgi:hypothetical protein
MEEQLTTLQQSSNILFRGGDAHEIALRVRSKALQLITVREKQRSVLQRKARPSNPPSTEDETRLMRRSLVFGAFWSILQELGETPMSNEPMVIALSHFLTSHPPCGLAISYQEHSFVDRVVRIYRHLCTQDTTHALALVRFWLAIGGTTSSLDAIHFLLLNANHLLPLRSLVHQWSHIWRTNTKRILRTSRSRHFSELSSTARKVRLLFCNDPRPLDHKDAHHTTPVDAKDKTGSRIRPSLCTSPCGAYLYMLSSEYGLVKLGTGTNGSITGRLYAQRVEFAVHAGGSVVCIRSGHPTSSIESTSSDMLLIRTPLLDSHQLLRIDETSLRVIGRVMLSTVPDNIRTAAASIVHSRTAERTTGSSSSTSSSSLPIPLYIQTSSHVGSILRCAPSLAFPSSTLSSPSYSQTWTLEFEKDGKWQPLSASSSYTDHVSLTITNYFPFFFSILSHW